MLFVTASLYAIQHRLLGFYIFAFHTKQDHVSRYVCTLHVSLHATLLQRYLSFLLVRPWILGLTYENFQMLMLRCCSDWQYSGSGRREKCGAYVELCKSGESPPPADFPPMLRSEMPHATRRVGIIFLLYAMTGAETYLI